MLVNRRAHQRAQAHADQYGYDHGDDRGDAHALVAIGDDHARQRGHRGHGQVDAAGDQHHGHAHGGDAVVGVVGEEVHEGAQRGKTDAAVANRAVGIDDQEDDHGGVHHDVLRIHDAAQKTLLLVHLATPPFTMARAWERLAIQLRTGSDCSTMITAMIRALKAIVESGETPK